MTFENWKEQVDKRIGNELDGLTADDLPDQDYWCMWEDGMTPAEVAEQTLLDFAEGRL